MADGVHDLTDSELHLPPQIRSFFWFHVYFTTRRLLFELGGIQNTFALPGDSTFDKNNNRYDLPSYNRLCNEFKTDPNTDFSFRKGSNHGLDEVFTYYTNEGYVKTPLPWVPEATRLLNPAGQTMLVSPVFGRPDLASELPLVPRVKHHMTIQIKP